MTLLGNSGLDGANGPDGDVAPVMQVRWELVPWYSRYHMGTITGGRRSSTMVACIESIWKRASTGKVRLYSDEDFDGVTLSINGENVVMRARGRFGRLYIQQ